MTSVRIILFLFGGIIALPVSVNAMLRSHRAFNIKPSLLSSATKSNLLKSSFTPKQQHAITIHKSEQKKHEYHKAPEKQKIDLQQNLKASLNNLKNASSCAVTQPSAPSAKWSIWGLLTILGLSSDADEKKEKYIVTDTPNNTPAYGKLVIEILGILENNEDPGWERWWGRSLEDSLGQRLYLLFASFDPNPLDIDTIITSMLLAKQEGFDADRLLYKLISYDEKLYQKIYDALLRNIKQLKKSKAFATLTYLYLSALHSEVAQVFCDNTLDQAEFCYLKSYLHANLKNIADNDLASKQFENHLQIACTWLDDGFLETFIRNIISLNQTHHGDRLLKGMLSSNASLAQKAKIYDACLAHFEHINLSFLKILVQYAPDKNKLAQSVANLPTTNFSSLIKILAFSKYTAHKQEINENALSQTEKHLISHTDKLEEAGVEKYQAVPELKNLTNTLIAKERELNTQNYYTFVHGQMRQFYFLQKLYTLAWEITTGKTATDYIFPYFKEPLQFYEQLEDEQNFRKTLLTTHITDGWISFNRTNNLFTNYGFFANIGNFGANTASYIANNRNIHHFSIQADEILNMFKLGPVYAAFESKINQLAADYNELCQHGNALLIAIPKEKVGEYVYPAKAGGYHYNLWPISNTTEDLMKLLTDKDKSQPFDFRAYFGNDIEFCIPMTFDLALNPQSGIKVFPFITGDAQKLKELQEREKKLFEEIKKFAGTKYVKKYRLGTVD